MFNKSQQPVQFSMVFQVFSYVFIIVRSPKASWKILEDQGPRFFPKSKLLAKVIVLTLVNGKLVCYWMVHMTLLY